jgi:biopolymer transport protein TolR
VQPVSPQKRMARKRREGLVHKRPAKLPQVRNEINVTPLVDVCLVLLIIFMVIIELLARGREVPLPKTRHHSSEADQNQPIVSIDADGNVFFDKDEIMPGVANLDTKLDELKKRVKEEWRSGKSKDQRVYVKADVTTEYKKVYPLIMAIHDLGVTSIDLGTTELKDEEP